MTLLIYGFLGLLLLVLVASFVLPIAKLKGKWRVTILAGVLAFWGHLYWTKIQKPEELAKWRAAGWLQCDLEQKQLPASFNLDGFVDEGAALRKASLLQLLSERRIKFVEIRVRAGSDGSARIVLPDGDQEPAWTLPTASSPFIRLQLGQVGDPACAALPYGVADRVDRIPFLPDTCITMTGLAVPTARYALTLRPGATPDAKQYGLWALVDRTNSANQMTLTTSDTSDSVSAGQLPRAGQSSFSDCRSPHTVIADRLGGADRSRFEQWPQLVSLEKRTASPDVVSVSQGTRSVPLLVPEIESTQYSEDETSLIFSPEGHKSAWEQAVNKARVFGSASHGANLLDWSNRRLVTLAPTATKDPYPWQVFAVNNGFIVLPTSRSWYDTESSLVARYSRDGAFLWAVRIAKPSSSTWSAWSAWSACSHFTPRAVYATASHLILASTCTKLTREQVTVQGKDTSGQLWKVPLRALPGNVE